MEKISLLWRPTKSILSSFSPRKLGNSGRMESLICLKDGERLSNKTASIKMAKLSLLTALLLQLLCLSVEIFGQSPCPQYFTYIINPRNEMMGQVQIPSPPKNVELHLKVGLSIAVALPTRYVGRLELVQSKEKSVQIVQQGGPLLYHVHFPLQQPIPKLTEIWFNNQLYCTGPRAAGQIVTSIVLDHTLYPSSVTPVNPPVTPYTTSQSIHPTSKTEFTTERPTTTSTSIIPINSSAIEQECGRPAVQSRTNNINLLIFGGKKTLPAQWPWLVALYFQENFKKEFRCAGSLVTNRHVITAAHCLKNPNSTNKPSSIISVLLGRYRLPNIREPGSEERDLANYVIHPDYKHSTDNGDSDLAILVLRIPVEFSSTIKPVCLRSGLFDFQNIIYKTGYVVGWGEDEFGNIYVPEPRMATAPIVSQEDCLSSNPQFVDYISNRTFCAGLRDGSGPCNGDSGGALVLYDSTEDRYQLRGIVSRGIKSSLTMRCDLSQYIIFVDIAKYMPWISQQIYIT